MELLIFLLVLLGCCQVESKAVFAHFMVTNSENYTQSDWTNDFSLALDAHIDAFALNMAYQDPINDHALAAAFTAANSVGFKLFFSFDYAGNGAWPKDDVIQYILDYGSNDAYYQYSGRPFVSTFEGPDNSADWVTIKDETSSFLVPDWSSLGAKAAVQKDIADGLFNWAAWPWGKNEMNTYVDASYTEYLGGMPYMMSVSPWFYTNLPGYNKNWLWQSDNLWHDRWQEVWYLQPEFVEIISWNDYGESHYIGPIYDKAMAAFTIGKAPFDYVRSMPHDGWRAFLPFIIDTYKGGHATIEHEGLVTWFRPQPKAACNDGYTTANTASQLQIEFYPIDVVEDRIFFSALLSAEADILITVGGVALADVSWTHTPSGGIGIYHGSALYQNMGNVVVSLTRKGATVAEVSGGSVTSSCTEGYENWNAWVGSDMSAATIQTTAASGSLDVCVEGTGIGNFAGLCGFTCQYGYCPIGACYCTKMGPQAILPNATGITGYPAEGEDANYSGLCSFACNYGYCPETACGTVSAPLTTPTSSPFTPPSCVSGEGDGNLAGLCSYACAFGYCPIRSCTCTAEGVLNVPPTANSSLSGVPLASVDYSLYHGLCEFACSRGYCPGTACKLKTVVPPTTTTSSSSPSSTASGASVTSFPTVTPNGAINPYLYSCTKRQQNLLLEAWAEAAVLAKGHYEWWPGGKWQDAMSLYLGSKSKDDYSFISGKGQLMKNIEREYNIHYGIAGTTPPLFTYGYFYCDESKVPGSQKKPASSLCAKPGVNAYSWDDLGSFWSAHYVVLCPRFFSNTLNSLAGAVKDANGSPRMQRTIDYWRSMRAKTVLHESYHWKDTVSSPRCLDITYKPSAVVKLGRTSPIDAAINAESYALAALAIFIQQAFHLDEPPKPQELQTTSDNATFPGADSYETYLDSPPDWWEPPVVNTSSTFSPNMTDTVIMSSLGTMAYSGPWDTCVESLYEDMSQCRAFCYGEESSCTESPTNSTVVCSGCVVQPSSPVCLPGSYKDWDTCDANCSGGACFENAGESGVQCEDCPSM